MICSVNHKEKKVQEQQTLTLHLGDCIDKMKELEEGSVGGIVCDPPYSRSGI
jgi:DNA modification methylase